MSDRSVVLRCASSSPLATKAKELWRQSGQSKQCLLCGQPPRYGAIFFPRDAQAFGARKDQGRDVLYHLCAVHADPTYLPQIEAKILLTIWHPN